MSCSVQIQCVGPRRRLVIGLLAVAMSSLVAERPAVTVVDHGLLPAVYPRYLGRGTGLGWQDRYNQDREGRLWVRREFEFRGVRLPWRVAQTFAGDPTRPVGRLGLRFVQSKQRVTSTQPRWIATWGRHDEEFPGLLDVTVGSKGLAGVPPTMTCGRTGAVGQVRFRWEHDQGLVEATFIMLPDDDRLFAEVAVTPRGPAEKLAVSLCCWPFGDFRVRTNSRNSPPLIYGKPHRLPEGDPTALFTDPAFDPTGKESLGTCGLTYFPGETRSVTAKRTFPLFLTLRLPPPEEGKTAYLHFSLWELLHRRGEDAWKYLAEREGDTLQQFGALPEIQDPRFAEARRRGLGEVRQSCEQVRARLSRVTLSSTRPGTRERDDQLRESVLHRRWARFFCDEAEHALKSGDWRAAMAAVGRARDRLDRMDAGP